MHRARLLLVLLAASWMPIAGLCDPGDPAPAMLAGSGPAPGGFIRVQNVVLPEIGGTWEGTYYYPDRKRPGVPFILELASKGTSISGKISEPNTFGDPGAKFLYAHVAGIIEGTKLRFVKTYDGTGGQSHSVYYEATLDPGTMTISGVWVISDRWSGQFRAARR